MFSHCPLMMFGDLVHNKKKKKKKIMPSNRNFSPSDWTDGEQLAGQNIDANNQKNSRDQPAGRTSEEQLARYNVGSNHLLVD
jgi:hypothetical protein